MNLKNNKHKAKREIIARSHQVLDVEEFGLYNGKPRRYTELGGESLGVLKIEQYYVESIFLFEEEVWYTISSDIY